YLCLPASPASGLSEPPVDLSPNSALNQTLMILPAALHLPVEIRMLTKAIWEAIRTAWVRPGADGLTGPRTRGCASSAAATSGSLGRGSARPSAGRRSSE